MITKAMAPSYKHSFVEPGQVSMRRLPGLLFLLVSGICWWMGASAAMALDIPAVLILTGTIQSGIVPPQANDLVQVIGPSGSVDGTGAVLNDTGNYVVELAKTYAFNGKTVILQLQQGSNYYQLLANNAPASFVFNGGILPSRLRLDATVGQFLHSAVATTTPTMGRTATPHPSPDNGVNYDLNGDGVVNQQDIQILRSVLAGELINNKADVNHDGVINTRDMIDIIKYHNANQQPILVME